MRYFLSFIFFVAAVALQAQTKEEEDAFRKLMYARMYMNTFYVDTVNSDRMTEDMIRGMLKAMDPHSTYTTAEETKAMNEPLQGNFEGIGIQFNVLEDTLVVLQTVPGGPSEKKGVLAGDRVIMVNDTAISGVKMARNDMMKRMRGPKGTKCKLGIKRGEDKNLIYFDIIRDKIPLHTVEAAYMIQPEKGYICVRSFGAKTAEEIAEAIVKLKEQGMQTLILDLQQNGGGYLNAAQEVASLFLNEGDTLVTTRGRAVHEDLLAVRVPEKYHFDGKIIVLVDEYSASAAEIVSGALQDYDRATVVGRRSFGKGLVQRPCPFPDGSMMRLTIARYYTPTGRCIQKPYQKGHGEDYSKDIEHRLKSGELTCRDSIHFADSLKYKTLKLGRTVYGGGGIMPDEFVPLDTTRIGKYHRQLIAKNCILNAVLKYVDKNRKKIASQYTLETFINDFAVTDDLWKLLEKEADKFKVEKGEREDYIGLQMKALVARDLWDMEAFYRIINTQNDIINRALQL